MPIYMDRHDVSEEVTAEIVADLHQKDLKIQHEFNCKGLTYWFDEKRKTAFCLIEAPNKAAIKKMHDKAHGQVPHQLIEVDTAVVESFLGRIEDPKKAQKIELNIINDPAFRTIMVIGLKPYSFKQAINKEVKDIIAHHHQYLIRNSFNEFNGKLAQQTSDHFLVSFDSVTNAVSCALKISDCFENQVDLSCRACASLNIGLCSGVPVNEKNGFFEDSIKTALSFYHFVKGTIVLTSEVKDLYQSENLNEPIGSSLVFALNESEEKFIRNLIDFTEREYNNPALDIKYLSDYLGISKSNLYRKIIAMTGKTPNNFIRDYRLMKALHLLNKKYKNISEIAFETGFNSPAYFSKCFQESFGLLPSQYIKT